MKYVRIGCQVLEVLIACEDGKKCLEDNPLIPEIVDLMKYEVACVSLPCLSFQLLPDLM